jgi:short-subunit dehydrogenase
LKTVLITGASVGIGYELAKIFAENNFSLVLVARREDKLKEIQARVGSERCEIFVCDLSEARSPQVIYNFTKQKSIQIDILVNNAGVGDYGLFHELKLEKQLQMIDLNIRSLTELTYLFGKDMVEKKSGKILNIASTAAFQPGPLMSVYYATKHFVLAFSEGLFNEWSDFGVTVTTLCPGPTASEFQAQAKMQKSKLVSTIKLPSANEVAQLGFEATMQGKRLAVHGFMNKLMVFSVRFTPRALILKVVRAIQSPN